MKIMKIIWNNNNVIENINNNVMKMKNERNSNNE